MKKIILLIAVIAASGLSVLFVNSYANTTQQQVTGSMKKALKQFQLDYRAGNGTLVRVFGTTDGFFGHGSAMIHIIMPDGTVIDDFVIFSGHTPDDKLAQLFKTYEGFEDAFWEAADGAGDGN
jgi:hypothetical protein